MTNLIQIQCPICNFETKKRTVLKNGNNFYHCDHCDFSGRDPKEFLNTELEKARYDQHENSIEDQGYVDTLERFLKFSLESVEAKEVLDYGSGPSPVLAELLFKKGYQVSIYDPFYAKNQYSNDHFDLITSTEVFEHFNEPLKEIEKLIKLVKPGGYIAVLTRFRPALEQFKSWFYKDDKTHVSFYSIKTFEYLAKRFNLKILKHDNFQHILLQKLNRL